MLLVLVDASKKEVPYSACFTTTQCWLRFVLQMFWSSQVCVRALAALAINAPWPRWSCSLLDLEKDRLNFRILPNIPKQCSGLKPGTACKSCTCRAVTEQQQFCAGVPGLEHQGMLWWSCRGCDWLVVPLRSNRTLPVPGMCALCAWQLCELGVSHCHLSVPCW